VTLPNGTPGCDDVTGDGCLVPEDSCASPAANGTPRSSIREAHWCVRLSTQDRRLGDGEFVRLNLQSSGSDGDARPVGRLPGSGSLTMGGRSLALARCVRHCPAEGGCLGVRSGWR
jgi:hypothetical protein